MKILIAEDNIVSRHLLERTLIKWGYEVVVTTNGREAWQVLNREDAPSIAIIDWMMPEMEGIEVCRRVRERENCLYTYLILLTSKTDKADLAIGLAAGADDYINKPFDYQELRSRMLVGERTIALEQKLAQKVVEHERTEQSLHNVHAETAQLLNAIQSILIGIDAESKIIRWNQAAQKVFALEESEVIGRSLHECGIQWEFPVLAELIADARSKQAPIYLNDIRLKRAPGEEITLGFALHPFKEEPGSNSGALLIGVDVTQRRISEGRLRQAQKLESIGQLAAGVAHEINSPTQYVLVNTRFLQDSFLTFIGMLEKHDKFLAVCRTKAVLPTLTAELDTALQEADLGYLSEEIPKALQQSLEGIERIAQIVQSMKDFAHPGSPEKQLEDLNRAIESTITVASSEWKYIADLRIDFDKDLPLVPCLLGEFNQVILNLIVNAVHAIKDAVQENGTEKGLITIRTRREGEWVEIRLMDTGSGIPLAVRSRIFDPFFTTKEVGRGTGQGLAISHTVIVEKHGGTLDFETELGHGTTFIIRLPLMEQSGAELAEMHA